MGISAKGVLQGCLASGVDASGSVDVLNLLEELVAVFNEILRRVGDRRQASDVFGDEVF